MRIATLSTVAAVGLLLAAAAVPAQAKDVDVSGTASCTGGVTAKIKAGPRDPGQIKTNVQIDDVGATRVVWTVTVTDGAQSQTVTARTAGRSNSIDVDVFTRDDAGADAVTFTASRAGATCSGSVTVP